MITDVIVLLSTYNLKAQIFENGTHQLLHKLKHLLEKLPLGK